MEWSRARPWKSIRNISLLIFVLFSISVLSYLADGLDLTELIAVDLGIFGAWITICLISHGNWSYIAFIEFQNKDIIELIKFGEEGENRFFIYKIKKQRIEMIFGIGEGFEYYTKDSKLKVSKKSIITRQILEIFIKNNNIRTFKTPKESMIEPEKIKMSIQRWKNKEIEDINNKMLVNWRNGNLSKFIWIIILLSYFLPFTIFFLIMRLLTDWDIGSILWISVASSVIFGVVFGIIIIIIYQGESDLHTPKYYSFYNDGMMIKLSEKGKVVYIDKKYISKMKIHSLLKCILVSYEPPSDIHQAKIRFIIRFHNIDKDRLTKIANKE